MKIAISSTGRDLESTVDIRFGRCPFFVIVEIEDNEIKSTKFIENPAGKLAGGAGPTAAEAVANEGVEKIITVNVGPRAFGVLQQLGIEIYQGNGKIKDVVQLFIEGKLVKISGATGPMHLGLGAGRRHGRGGP
ncbi:hypothetical protein DRJ17_05215 [Candidatus Woesearchaeota archaeon]|nr:MAG: hypothetical protein DRJ17_05215 [Candidatus Woesearchaeota archaeon]